MWDLLQELFADDTSMKERKECYDIYNRIKGDLDDDLKAIQARVKDLLTRRNIFTNGPDSNSLLNVLLHDYYSRYNLFMNMPPAKALARTLVPGSCDVLIYARKLQDNSGDVKRLLKAVNFFDEIIAAQDNEGLKAMLVSMRPMVVHPSSVYATFDKRHLWIRNMAMLMTSSQYMDLSVELNTKAETKWTLQSSPHNTSQTFPLTFFVDNHSLKVMIQKAVLDNDGHIEPGTYRPSRVDSIIEEMDNLITKMRDERFLQDADGYSENVDFLADGDVNLGWTRGISSVKQVNVRFAQKLRWIRLFARQFVPSFQNWIYPVSEKEGNDTSKMGVLT